MPQKIIVYWRDIPAQVIIKAGRKNAKRQLPERFEQAIDMAAMRSGASETDDYLADWRRADPEDIAGDDIEALADSEAASLDTTYDAERIKTLIANGGRAS
ncbi:MAG: virulence factor [Pseudomonadota bacterium]